MNMVIHNIGDELGPAKILLLQAQAIGLEALVVVDNTACGPAIGGARMATAVTGEEIFRLARAMTFKHAAAGLAHGGGRTGFIADPACDPARKERLMWASSRRN